MCQIGVESCHFFLRNKRLTKLDDALYFPPLPILNNHDCSVCLGDFKYRVTADVLENIESLEKYFFDSAFNTDLSQLFHGKIPRQIASLKRGGEHTFDAWQKISMNDICSVEWFSYQSFGKCLSHILGKE